MHENTGLIYKKHKRWVLWGYVTNNINLFGGIIVYSHTSYVSSLVVLSDTVHDARSTPIEKRKKCQDTYIQGNKIQANQSIYVDTSKSNNIELIRVHIYISSGDMYTQAY